MNTSRCRVCLSEKDCTRNIFTDKCSNGQSYAEALMSCLDGATIMQNDAMPSHICEACVSGLETWAVCGVIDDDLVSKYSSSECRLIDTNIKIEPGSEEYPQVRQVETRIFHIKTEEISLKTEPDDEYFRIDLAETKPPEYDPYEKTFGDEFNEKRLVLEELRTHTVEKSFECVDCGKGFDTKTQLTMRTSKEPFKCNQCEKTVSKSIMKRHECDLCKKRFREKSTLDRHLRIHTGQRPFVCEYCEKAFRAKSDLTIHIRTHTKEKPFKCNRCEKAFNINYHLTEHLRTHTGENPYKCDQCEKTFNHKSNMRRHLKRHTGKKPHGCDLCKKRFSERTTLVAHLRTHTGNKPYMCDQCEKAFYTKKNLTRHLQTHASECYKCDQCEKKFNMKAYLTQHLQIHLKEKPFECEQCEKKYSNKKALVRHLQIHAGKKLFKCDNCAMLFVDVTSCMQHLETCTGEKQFECDNCKKAFSTKDTLMQHLQTYISERPYEFDHNVSGSQPSDDLSTDNLCKPEQKYTNSSSDFTNMIVEMADIKTEEIYLKTEPDDE